jgi:hypothetical protein
MSQFRILDDNWFFNSSAEITASSSDTNFPVSNLARFFRSQVWRSNATGNFVIDSTNNKLNFKESGGGSELTATLTSGTYTSTTLAAEIKARMEDAGAETYTVSQSAITGTWTIATGGVYLALLRSSGTDTASSVWGVIGFGTLADSTGSLTYTGANIALHTEEWVVIDLQTTEEIDSFAMVFNPIASEGIKFSDDAVIKLQANASDSWASPAVDVTLSTDPNYDVITYFFTSDQSYRYWRIKIVDPKNAYLYVEIGKLLLAKATQLTQMPEFGFKFKVNDQSKISKTPYGHRYADIYPSLRQLQFDYKAMVLADLETLYQIYARVGNMVPMGFALDPTETLFDKDQFFIYGYLNNEFSSGQAFYSYFDSAIQIEEGA